MQVVEEAVSEEVDISVPYDAAAKLAYETSDKSMAYDDFKVKYEADAVADVLSKQAPKENEKDVVVAVVEEDSPSEEVDILFHTMQLQSLPMKQVTNQWLL